MAQKEAFLIDQVSNNNIQWVNGGKLPEYEEVSIQKGRTGLCSYAEESKKKKKTCDTK